MPLPVHSQPLALVAILRWEFPNDKYVAWTPLESWSWFCEFWSCNQDLATFTCFTCCSSLTSFWSVLFLFLRNTSWNQFLLMDTPKIIGQVSANKLWCKFINPGEPTLKRNHLHDWASPDALIDSSSPSPQSWKALTKPHCGISLSNP